MMTASLSTEAALVADLVRVPSLSGEEHALQDLIVDWFATRGMSPGVEPAADGLRNVVVEIEGNGPGPVIFIGGHCDTVDAAPDWQTYPWSPTITGDRMYGLGAMDMKGGLGCAMLAVADLAACRATWPGKVIFAALADEEARSRGAYAFLAARRAAGETIDAAFMCEPNFDAPIIGAMGKFNIVVDVTGRSAHGSRPEEGVSAITAAGCLIAALADYAHPAHPLYGPANHCILSMRGGPDRYEIRVPDQASFLINWHVMPGETSSGVIAGLQAMAAGLGSEAQFDFTVSDPRYEAYAIDPAHPFLRDFSAVYESEIGHAPAFGFGRGVSDGNIFATDGGIPTLLFGPPGSNMHAAGEWLDLSKLPLVRRILRSTALRHLRGSAEWTISE